MPLWTTATSTASLSVARNSYTNEIHDDDDDDKSLVYAGRMRTSTNDFQYKDSNLAEINRIPETIESKFRCPA
jgi:hypothetical protein